MLHRHRFAIVRDRWRGGEPVYLFFDPHHVRVMKIYVAGATPAQKHYIDAMRKPEQTFVVTESAYRSVFGTQLPIKTHGGRRTRAV